MHGVSKIAQSGALFMICQNCGNLSKNRSKGWYRIMKNVFKKAFCVLLCVITAVSFAACSKNGSSKSELLSGLTDSVDETNVTATVTAIEKGLKEFDTAVFESCVNSSTLDYIIGFSKGHSQFSDLGKAIFENLTMDIKSIDLDKKTVTLSVNNKQLYIVASNFAGDLKEQYSTTQLLKLLKDDAFLDSSLSTLIDGIKNAQMQDQPKEITLTFEQKDGYLVFNFDENAESAVSGGALEAVKSVWS